MQGGDIRVEQRVRTIIRFAGVILPLSLALLGVIPGLHLFRDTDPNYLFPLIMISWLVLSLALFVIPSSTNRDALVRLSVYHLCVGAYILFVTGFAIPFIPLGWVLLLLVTYIYLGKIGILLNFLALFFVVTGDAFLHGSSRQHIVMDIISVLSIFIIGAIIVVLHRIQRSDSEELLKSKAQESLQSGRMNTLINNLADAVININEEGKVELYNAASLNLLNTNIGLHEQPIDNVIKVEDQSGKPVKLLQIAKKAKGVKVRDDLSLRIDDETIRLEVTASPVRSSYSRSKGQSATDGYILILRDITKAKSLEEERDEFISVVSHELRTPITIVEGTLSNVQLMLERGKTPPGTIERGLADAHEQIMFLSRMVNDLSTLSRAERGVADAAEEIDIKSMIDGLFNEYAPQAKKRDLLFDIDVVGTLGTITASHLYLRELLQNLITNAIKYTKEGTITLRVARKDAGVTFEVIDTGIGISKSDQAKVFNKFYRSEDYRTRETGGTGLGLYVASKLSKKLGTTINLKSRLNHGSTFSFSLTTDTTKKR